MHDKLFCSCMNLNDRKKINKLGEKSPYLFVSYFVRCFVKNMIIIKFSSWMQYNVMKVQRFDKLCYYGQIDDNI